MEQNFQTSFIPKKPIIEDKSKSKQSTNIFLFITLFIFLFSVALFFILYFYSSYLNNKIKEVDKSLKSSDSTSQATTLVALQKLESRLTSANSILDSHITISPIFKILQGIIIKNVTFNDFSYSLDEKGNTLVKMSGEAKSYRDLAIQSDLFSQDKNLKNPIFSNLSLNPKGNITFNLEFYVDKDLVNYRRSIELQAEN